MNKEPTDEMINKKLAEFMGFSYVERSGFGKGFKQWKCKKTGFNSWNDDYCNSFTESLDELVPVLDKLECSIHNTNKHDGKWQVVLRFSDMNKPIQDWYEDEKIQKAAALATYYAVMENEKNG